MTEEFLLSRGFLFLLVFARVSGFLILTPVIGGKIVPRTVRFAEAVLFSLVVLPSLWHRPEILPESAIDGAVLLAVESFVGLAAGAMLAILLAAFAMLGDLVSRLGGFSVSSSFDPAFGESVPVLSTFLGMLGMTVFVLAGGLDQAIAGLFDSFVRIAPNTAPNTASTETAVLNAAVAAADWALRLAGPVILSSLTVWTATGIVARTFPQMNMMPISFSANALLTLTVLSLSLAVSMAAFQNEAPSMIRRLFDILTGVC